MSGIVVVSHSRPLAEAAVALVAGLVPGLEVRLQIAAGTPDGGLGTDPTDVVAAIEAVDDGEGVLVLADVGSGVMSAQMALELIGPELAERAVVSPAPLVEGLLAAYAAAGTGCSFTHVCERAASAAADKQAQVEG
ncbi:dihydroxyacetone kinase phosphoryl donor subunit DhaM [Actinomyces faecalis]|uniref:dihydroxyacetone kinase phosphoryl donor subunit DhaM n=1 Tax=Actinomyces faecalis TaxID=2722820 RepID=UPI0015528B50|nr:dihydroxyacetone kinase phosphoryl donor subunit DhaM [Actinomyces faecalis]